MKVSIKWLKEYVAFDVDAESLAARLTMMGLEVEALVDRYAYLDRAVVGKIIHMEPHPKNNSLHLCKVDIGQKELSIVCGATNVEQGDVVAVGLPGMKLSTNVVIEPRQVYGLLSEGMLCSQAELGLGPDQTGVLILVKESVPGQKLSDAFGLSDIVMEFKLTPNRADCFSVIGIAREIAALLNLPLILPKAGLVEGDTSIETLISVSVESPQDCLQYFARVVTGVKIGPSPQWLQNRLVSVGIRSVNNVVDVTNFVLMEMGQPLHAFDYDRLAGHQIVVRTARAGETFKTLDGVVRTLDSGMVLICDAKQPVALGGIMGGENSEILDGTTNILLESAYFNPATIRRAAKKLGLSTDSSHRFERGVDPEGLGRALDRAAQLIVEVAGGQVAQGPAHGGGLQFDKRAVEPIELSIGRTNRLLGTKLSAGQVIGHLRSIGLKVEVLDDDSLSVVPPSFRVDLLRPIDLVEEVARLMGYDQIPVTSPVVPMIASPPTDRLRLREQVKEILLGCGFSETLTYSFIGADSFEKLSLSPDDRLRSCVTILNPLTEDQRVMRTSLVPGLLSTAYLNQTHRNYDMRIFEVGKVFFAKKGAELADEIEMISGLWVGARHVRSWHSKGDGVDFYDVKGVIETLLGALDVKDVTFRAGNQEELPYFCAGSMANVYSENVFLGTFGQLAPFVTSSFNLKRPAFCFDLSLDKLIDRVVWAKKARPFSRFPSVGRDIALILNDAVEVQQVVDFILGTGADFLVSADVFDVYRGKPIAEGKKSVALRLTYLALDRSLRDDEINVIHEVVTKQVLDAFKAALPLAQQ